MTIQTRSGRVVGNKGGAKSRPKRPFTVTTPVPDPPTPGADESQAMIDFKDEFLARTEPTHPAALDDAMQREMVLMTNVLTARANCTHVAVQDGNWTATGTFLKVSDNTFEVPTVNAKVGIPQGITVTYDANVDTVIDYIRCDGKFVALRGADRKLVVDTFVGCCTSDIEIGTAASPFTNDFEMEFPGSTNLDPAVDKFLIGRGFLTMGKVRICGAEKVHRMKMTTGMSAGATSFTAPVTPTGWAIGDEISIGSTDPSRTSGVGSNRQWLPPYIEHVTITNISGTTITFTPALSRARTIPVIADMTDIGYWIGNFTRNIKFYSPPGTLVHRRAHNMQMGADTDIRWASADLMGRTIKGTSKSTDTPIVSFAATDNAMRIAVRGSDIDWLATSNVQGRYNWHHHRSGNFGSGDVTAYYEGIAVSDAVGWAVSHHESMADFDKVCVRRFVGAGMMAEIGNEVGTWSDCLVMGVTAGDVWEALGDIDAEKARIQTRYTDNAAYDNDIGTFDFGRTGAGYWYRSRVVATTGCVAQDCTQGFVWVSRGVGAQAPGSLTPEPRVFYGDETLFADIGSDKPIITQHDDCEAIGVRFGLLVIKANPRQKHDLRSHFRRFTAWNGLRGIQVQYTGLYSFTKLRLHAAAGDGGAALGVGNTAIGMAFVDCIVRGEFDQATSFPSNDIGNIGPDDVQRHKVVDLDKPAEMPLYLADKAFIDTANGGNVVTYGTRADFNYPPDLTLVPAAEYVDSSQGFLKLDGTMNDEAGDRQRDILGASVELLRGNRQRMLTKYGYYTYDSSNWLLVPDLLESSFADPITDELTKRYLTVCVRRTASVAGYPNKGALPQRYVDAILIGRGTPPGSPDANAGHWVVYEDALGVGGIYEGL